MLYEQDFSSICSTDVVTQQLIAPVLLKMVADCTFVVGDEFIVDCVNFTVLRVGQS